MGAQSYNPSGGASASTIEGLQLPLERVLVNVGFLLNDTRSFPAEAMERLDIIHREAAKLYEAVTRLTHGELVGEVEV
ncbi:MAG: hypothetical protein RX318_01180 [bacterium]|nr:hypothetical protein [bacterium]